MKRKITFIADDGKEFETEKECSDYEHKKRKEKAAAITQTIWDLDTAIWHAYYPDIRTEDEEPRLNIAYMWLKQDIVHILSDKTIDMETAKEDILTRIKATAYHEAILSRYIHMDEIMKEVEIRRDYLTALKAAKSGGDVSNEIRYTLGKRDLEQLAKLHKSGKCRKKIEDLLTDCNFHYECGKFRNKEYDEFLDKTE